MDDDMMMEGVEDETTRQNISNAYFTLRTYNWNKETLVTRRKHEVTEKSLKLKRKSRGKDDDLMISLENKLPRIICEPGRDELVPD